MAETVLPVYGGYGFLTMDNNMAPSLPDWLSMVTSTAWPVANLVMYYPFSIDRPLTVSKMGWQNGATVSASYHLDVGFYNEAGSKLVSTGSIAQGTLSTIQLAATTATYTLNGPGRYYYAITGDNVLLTVLMRAAQGIGTCAAWGIMEETTGGFGLPATWTPVVAAHETWTWVMAGGGALL